MSISPISTTILPTSQAVQPAAASDSTTDNSGNNITLNVQNNIDLTKSQVGTQNVTVAQEFDLAINGSNNNITINDYNTLITNAVANNQPSAVGGITPVQNPDGSVSFTNADGSASTLQDYIAQLLGSLVQGLMANGKASGAYGSAASLSSAPATQGTALDTMA
jgi:hypothetical protein